MSITNTVISLYIFWLHGEYNVNQKVSLHSGALPFISAQ